MGNPKWMAIGFSPGSECAAGLFDTESGMLLARLDSIQLAERIAKCVNLHEELVSQVQALLFCAKNNKLKPDTDYSYIEAILAQAGGSNE